MSSMSFLFQATTKYLLPICALVFLTAASLPAVVVTWSGATDGDLSDPTNWVGGVAPVAGDDVVFETSATTTSLFTGGMSHSWNTITFSTGGSAFTFDESASGESIQVTTNGGNGLVNDSGSTQIFNCGFDLSVKPYVRINSGDVVFNGSLTLPSANSTYWYGDGTSTITINGTLNSTSEKNLVLRTGSVVEVNSNNATTAFGRVYPENDAVIRVTDDYGIGQDNGTNLLEVKLRGGSSMPVLLEVSGDSTLDNWFNIEPRYGTLYETPHVRSIGDNTIEGTIRGNNRDGLINLESVTPETTLTITADIRQENNYSGHGDGLKRFQEYQLLHRLHRHPRRHPGPRGDSRRDGRRP